MSHNVSEKMVSDKLEKMVPDKLEKMALLESIFKAEGVGPDIIREIDSAESNCSISAKIPWLKFKDEIFSEKAEVVRRLRSEAREGKVKVASRASQEHTIVDIGGGSSTAQNEPPSNHQGLPVGGDHQFLNVQVNGSTNEIDKYAPESSDKESGMSSTLADETEGGSSTAQNEPPPNYQGLYVGTLRSRASQEHINFETGGGSLTAQNEPQPNHQGLPVGDHQFHNVQVNGSTNQTDNYAPESADMESGRSSTPADNEPAEHTNIENGGGSSTAQNEPPPNHQGLSVGGNHQFHNVQVNGSINQTDNYPPESADMESGRSSTVADNEPAPDNFGNDTVFMVVGEVLSIALAVISAKKGEGEKTIQAEIFLYVLTVFILVGIISLFYGLCLSRAGGRVGGSIVARVVNTVCYVAVGLAVATGAGLQLPSHVMVWVIPLVWGIIAPAIVCYAINQ